MDNFVFTPEMLNWLQANDPEAYRKALAVMFQSQTTSQANVQSTPPPCPSQTTYQNTTDGSVYRPRFNERQMFTVYPDEPDSQPFDSPAAQTPVFTEYDDEYVPETQPEAQPAVPLIRRRGKGKAKATEPEQPKVHLRNTAYTKTEDCTLIGCYMEQCVNSIQGTNQKWGTFWRSVAERYETARRDNMIQGRTRRTHDSLHCRFGRMKEEMADWLIVTERARRIVKDRSGPVEADIIPIAEDLHKEKWHKGFTMHKQWECFKKYLEWDTVTVPENDF